MKNNSTGTKALLAVVTLVLVAYFGLQGVRYYHDPLTTTLAYAYQVQDGIEVSGWVVRDELVLPDDTNGLLRLQRMEGEKVSRGGTVAKVYADQASLDRQSQLDALNTQIEQLRYAQEAAFGSEVSLKLDNQIMQNILDFHGDLAANRLDRAEAHEAQIRALVLKRDYTYSETEDLSGQIAELEKQRNQLQSQAARSTRSIKAPAAGIYSAVVDGYETVLTEASLKTLTPEKLSDLKPQDVHSETGKLILGDEWYYAMELEESQVEQIRRAPNLTLRFAKSVERDLPVKLYHVSQPVQGKVVVVLQGKTYLSQLTLLRQQSADLIQETIQGLRIPKEALRATKVTVNEDGTRTETDQIGVYCVVGAETRFKPVKVVYNGDGYVLVRSAMEDLDDVMRAQEKTRLRPGDQVIVSAGDLYDGKIVT